MCHRIHKMWFDSGVGIQRLSSNSNPRNLDSNWLP